LYYRRSLHLSSSLFSPIPFATQRAAMVKLLFSSLRDTPSQLTCNQMYKTAARHHYITAQPLPHRTHHIPGSFEMRVQYPPRFSHLVFPREPMLSHRPFPPSRKGEKEKSGKWQSFRSSSACASRALGSLRTPILLMLGERSRFPLPVRQALVPYYLLEGGGYINTLYSPFESSSPITNNSRFLLKGAKDAQNLKHICQQTNLQLFIPVEVP